MVNIERMPLVLSIDVADLVVRAGSHISPLFDRSRAYKRGSTIPIKLQLLNANNMNISSSSTILTTRSLIIVRGNTSLPVADAGNANPYNNFRFDSSLSGTNGAYVFNLNTKGLAVGQYVLSCYVGSDRSFFYTVKFEVR